jgi:NitT/TauT family transport system substrate-binding protein
MLHNNIQLNVPVRRLTMKTLCIKLTLLLLSLTVVFAPANVMAEKPKFTIAKSIYAGWMPWYYAKSSGIMKKWADKYNIEVDLVHMDYIPSIEAYVAGKAAGCVMTNMEVLDMPAASGIDSTVLILGDYSNGNDAILTRDNITAKNIKGQEVYLVELSVSHYLLARFLEKSGLKEKQVKLVNTSDSDIGPAFIANKNQKVVVTWNPIVMKIEQNPGIKKIFTSADIPGHILDLMVVRTDVLKKHPELGKALVGAWYEVMSLMSKRTDEANRAIAQMAEFAGSSITEYKNQLKTTAMFYTPQSASDYTEGQEIKKNMDSVRHFCFKHGLFGEGAESVDIVGILYPDKTVQGNAKNIKLRFDSSYTKMAAQGKL